MDAIAEALGSQNPPIWAAFVAIGNRRLDQTFGTEVAAH